MSLERDWKAYCDCADGLGAGLSEMEELEMKALFFAGASSVIKTLREAPDLLFCAVDMETAMLKITNELAAHNMVARAQLDRKRMAREKGEESCQN